MALTEQTRKEVLDVWTSPTENVPMAITTLAAALLDLHHALYRLEERVGRVEQLAGRRTADLP